MAPFASRVASREPSSARARRRVARATARRTGWRAAPPGAAQRGKGADAPAPCGGAPRSMPRLRRIGDGRRAGAHPGAPAVRRPPATLPPPSRAAGASPGRATTPSQVRRHASAHTTHGGGEAFPFVRTHRSPSRCADGAQHGEAAPWILFRRRDARGVITIRQRAPSVVDGAPQQNEPCIPDRGSSAAPARRSAARAWRRQEIRCDTRRPIHCLAPAPPRRILAFDARHAPSAGAGSAICSGERTTTSINRARGDGPVRLPRARQCAPMSGAAADDGGARPPPRHRTLRSVPRRPPPPIAAASAHADRALAEIIIRRRLSASIVLAPTRRRMRRIVRQRQASPRAASSSSGSDE